MILTDKHIAVVLTRECRNCGHWLSAHRTGNSPDKRPIFYCVGNDAPANSEHGDCDRCPEAGPVRFGELWMGRVAA